MFLRNSEENNFYKRSFCKAKKNHLSKPRVTTKRGQHERFFFVVCDFQGLIRIRQLAANAEKCQLQRTKVDTWRRKFRRFPDSIAPKRSGHHHVSPVDMCCFFPPSKSKLTFFRIFRSRSLCRKAAAKMASRRRVTCRSSLAKRNPGGRWHSLFLSSF